MRKAAGLKRGSKKKQQEESASLKGNSDGSVASSSTTGETRRKPTNDEAALTSKNYRLAKELSELRVRHRDETKNVTRLTMENMNLASRCREAISHVAMLKKELAMHQKRASEALQRSQSQRSAPNHSDSGVLSELSDLARPSGNSAPSSTDVAVEMDRMDRIMASHAPPPPPPLKDGEEGDDEESPRRSVAGESDESPTSDRSSSQSSSSPPTNEIETSTPDASDRAPSLFPHTASPKPRHRLNYNDDYPGDIAPHKASHESSLPAVQDEEEESASSEQQQQNPSVSRSRAVANLKLSSIDAFEASFDTAFPSSFASPKEGEHVTSEIYNPFFSSPQKKGTLGQKSPLNRETTEAGSNGGNAESKSRKWGASVRSPKSSSAKKSVEEQPPSESTPKQQQQPVSPVHDADKDRDRNEARSPERETEQIESSSRMPDPSSSPKIVSRASNYTGGSSATTGEYQTPPHHMHPKAQEKAAEKPADQPRRPEKSISASARARYEKALQPRGYHSRMKDPSSDRAMEVEAKIDATMEQARNSPGTVLRRLQQRRAKADRFQPTVDANSNPIPGMDARRSNRSLRHPPTLSATENGDGVSQSPFDESGRKVDRRGSGGNAMNGSGPYRNSQNDSENNYQRSSKTQTYPAAKKLSPDSMNAEIRALDAMAGSYQKPGGDSPTGSDRSHNSGSSSSSSRYAALKQRRSVKQPVSYAEPSLNTKIRRGDEYFPRRVSSDGNDDPVQVSPVGSSPEDLNGSRRTASSRARAGASSDEVLKDLGGGGR